MGKMKELYMKYVEMGIIRDGILPEEYMKSFTLPDIKKDLESEEKQLNLNKI